MFVVSCHACTFVSLSVNSSRHPAKHLDSRFRGNDTITLMTCFLTNKVKVR